jgi:hypothetical protein
VARELGYKRVCSIALHYLGLVANCQADAERATVLLRESLALRRETGDQEGVADCLQALAGVARLQGQPQRAIRVLGTADNLRGVIGVPVPHSDRANYDQEIGVLRAPARATRADCAHTRGRAIGAGRCQPDQDCHVGNKKRSPRRRLQRRRRTHDPGVVRARNVAGRDSGNARQKDTAIIRKRVSHNEALWSQVQDSSALGAALPQNLGERNFYDWDEVATYSIGKWNNVLYAKE